MSGDLSREPMLDMFIFETTQLLEQLEQLTLESEKLKSLSEASINETFRIMHTIKGAAAMMLYNNIAELAHSIEDVFYYIRENRPSNINLSKLSDIIFEGIDFIKKEIEKIENGETADGNAESLIENIKNYLTDLKDNNPDTQFKSHEDSQKDSSKQQQKFYIAPQKKSSELGHVKYRAVIHFEDGCEMENIRAFSVIHDLKGYGEVIGYSPGDIIESDKSIDIIRKDGFKIIFSSEKSFEEMERLLSQTVLLKELKIDVVGDDDEEELQYDIQESKAEDGENEETPKRSESFKVSGENNVKPGKQSIISVNIDKLDRLMDLMGEIVIAEAMVTRNPDLAGLHLENFNKASRQLRTITNELQDIVMSIRMVPLSTTFLKMQRIVRDMSRKLDKDVELEIIGEETEVDKNIIEHLSDPLMHLVRNSIDHGIEGTREREKNGKVARGKVTLEAKNEGRYVWISVKDDGGGLNKEKIMNKAIAAGLTNKGENELTDREIYSFILKPGFSTKEKVTEFSGRGVGMDVVASNIEEVGGTVIIDSIPGRGTTISLKIPLTLAIIDGMQIRVGSSMYTVPVTSIKQSFKVKEEDIIIDPDGNEMMMVRGECYPIVRLHRKYNIKTDMKKISEGIIMMVESTSKSLCLFADALIGEQQVVVKTLPRYLKKVKGISGCTLLGDGSISLILDIETLAES